MSMRRWVAIAFTALVAAVGCNRAPTHPNLVLIVIDALRADHLGSYGYPRAQTPRLDGVAARGTRFSAARAPSSWALPSVASILTGRYPIEHGVARASATLNEQHVTIAETLAAAGYETAAFSANVSLVVPDAGFAQGFERFEVLETLQAGRANTVTDAVLTWHGKRHRDRPYFLYVHYFDPHATYAPPVAYAEKLGVRRDDPLLAGGQNIVTFRSKPPGEKEIATLVALYDAEIAFTDAEIGRLLDGLGFGKLGKTVVVLTADHGEEFGDHGGMLHGRTLFEEMIHVPLLVAGGDLPSGRVVDTPVSLVSIAATLAELAEATPPADLAGRSLVRALHAAPDTPTMVFAELATTNAVHRGAAIDGTWKLVLNRGFVPSLYDLATDPAERTSLHESQGERRTILQKEIGAHNKVGSKARAAAPPMERSLSANRRERLRQLGDFE